MELGWGTLKVGLSFLEETLKSLFSLYLVRTQ